MNCGLNIIVCNTRPFTSKKDNQKWFNIKINIDLKLCHPFFKGLKVQRNGFFKILGQIGKRAFDFSFLKHYKKGPNDQVKKPLLLRKLLLPRHKRT
jgi:hypothetical protein